jgi:anthranilate phosphoribosyltransferase
MAFFHFILLLQTQKTGRYSIMINQAIAKLVNGDDLGEKEMTEVMEMLLEGMAESAQIGALVTALRMKGETIEEITGAAKAMRSKTKQIELAGPVVNIDRDEFR